MRNRNDEDKVVSMEEQPKAELLHRPSRHWTGVFTPDLLLFLSDVLAFIVFLCLLVIVIRVITQ